jgi:hypothetical protein
MEVGSRSNEGKSTATVILVEARFKRKFGVDSALKIWTTTILAIIKTIY